MKNQISVLRTTNELLSCYYAKVIESPNRVTQETENLAYAIIYLVNRYIEEFREDPWVDVFKYYIDQIDEIETRYPDMVIFQAPLWCCLNRIDSFMFWLDGVLDYGLSQMSMGRMIYLNYAYLVVRENHYKSLLKYLNWYCKEGKGHVDGVMYLFMISKGDQDEKLAILKELYCDPDCRRFPQMPGYIEPYLNKEFIPNIFADVDQWATNTILDYVLFRDLTMTAQLEIDLSKRTG